MAGPKKGKLSRETNYVRGKDGRLKISLTPKTDDDDPTSDYKHMTHSERIDDALKTIFTSKPILELKEKRSKFSGRKDKVKTSKSKAKLTKSYAKKLKDGYIKVSKNKEKLKKLPSIAKAPKKINFNISKRSLLYCATLILVMFGGWQVLSGDGSKSKTDSKKSTSSPSQSTTEVAGAATLQKTFSPKFAILTPPEKTLQLLGGVVNISPQGAPEAYAYIDIVDDIQIRVTQQQITDTIKKDPAGQLEKIAKDFQATNVIQIDDTKVYHGLNEKTNIQSLVTIKGGLLVLIAASQKISEDSWVGYIRALQ